MPGIDNGHPRITVVTAGHLATCPRMLKAADALVEEGYDVRVVSTRTVAWADAADHDLMARRAWRWQPIDLRQETAGARYVRTGVRWRASQALARAVGVRTAPFSVAVRAYSRVHDEIVRAIASEPVDFIYGGTTGALAAIAGAGRRLGVRFALDLEDYHRGQQDETNAFENRLAKRIEDRVLDGAEFLTAGSGAIAGAYAEDARFDPVPIHNTFPLPAIEPAIAAHDRPLRAYWFSQGIGGGRGLEDAVHALGRLGEPVEMTLRGRSTAGYVGDLRALAAAVAPKLTIVTHEPASPDAMVDLCRGYDFGLSLDRPSNPNRNLCLCNKIFTYLLAGLPVVMTDTRAQRELARDLGDAAVLYGAGDADGLARALRRWSQDRQALAAAKAAAWAAARRRWHWEHPADRGALMDLVNHTVRRSRARAARAHA